MSNPKLAEMAQKSGNLWQTQAQAYKFLEDAYQLGVTDGLKEGLSCPGKEIEEAYKRGRAERKHTKKLKLKPGPCARCGKIIRIQKIWCSPICERQWEIETRSRAK